jgi:hypothetical protein
MERYSLRDDFRLFYLWWQPGFFVASLFLDQQKHLRLIAILIIGEKSGINFG